MESLHFSNLHRCMSSKPIYCSTANPSSQSLSLSNRSPKSKTLARLLLFHRTINSQTTTLTLSTCFNGVQRQAHHLHRQDRPEDGKNSTAESSLRRSIGSTSRYGVWMHALFANYFIPFQIYEESGLNLCGFGIASVPSKFGWELVE